MLILNKLNLNVKLQRNDRPRLFENLVRHHSRQTRSSLQLTKMEIKNFGFLKSTKTFCGLFWTKTFAHGFRHDPLNGAQWSEQLDLMSYQKASFTIRLSPASQKNSAAGRNLIDPKSFWTELAPQACGALLFIVAKTNRLHMKFILIRRARDRRRSARTASYPNQQVDSIITWQLHPDD